ncbi:MAG: murein biosynthesis integral membrane protein MurJ [Myxococcaceae bacterium]
MPSVAAEHSPAPRRSRGALAVATGILVSRLIGLVRERVFAHYLGNSPAAAAFRAAIRIPNVLQNLLGEGVLSGSLIPVYARLLGKDATAEAREVAWTVLGVLAALVAALGALGALFAQPLVELLVPGFSASLRALSVDLVRILFPATGLLVLSAWCLGILNSHRRFFLPYAAPVVWSLAQIVALLVAGGFFDGFLGGDTGALDGDRLVRVLALGVLTGSVLQFLIQVPTVFRLLGGGVPTFNLAMPSVRDVAFAFVPVVLGRGVVQLSGLFDNAYASLISPRAVSALGYAQVIYLLPVSLFGMAISAAELPEMARESGAPSEARAAGVRTRLAAALSRMAFFVVPSALALALLGDVLGAALYQTGRFDAGDSRYLGYVLLGYGVALWATTSGRLYASALYALGDAKAPFRSSLARVGLTLGLGYPAAVMLPALLGVPAELGAAALTLLSAFGAWLEVLILRRRVRLHVGPWDRAPTLFAKRWLAGGAGVAAGLFAKWGMTQRTGASAEAVAEWGGRFFATPAAGPLLTAGLVLGAFCVAYGLASMLMGVPETVLLARFKRGPH